MFQRAPGVSDLFTKCEQNLFIALLHKFSNLISRDETSGKIVGQNISKQFLPSRPGLITATCAKFQPEDAATKRLTSELLPKTPTLIFCQVNNILMSKSLGQLFNFLKSYSTCFCASPATAPPRSFGRLAFFTIIQTPLDCLSLKFLFVFYSHWPNIFHSLLSNSVHLR